MIVLRRILGVLVMIAGILGLVLSLAGIIGVWALKPAVARAADNTLTTLTTSLQTSQGALLVTGQALGATIDSVDALSTMLDATAASVQDTQPILDQLETFMGEQLPATMESATTSLDSAQQAAQVLDSAIASLDNFRSVLSGVPLIGGYINQNTPAYNPEKPLADSLGELSSNIKGLPEMFTTISDNLDKADNNLVTIQDSLTTMSENVGLISDSLSEYEKMIAQSQTSMQDLEELLTNIQDNLSLILNGMAIVISLFLLWLLAAQVVIFSQGWELYQGTAGRMEGGTTTLQSDEPASQPDVNQQ